MVHVKVRMRKLREVSIIPAAHVPLFLLWIRVGPGALILPKDVSKISLEFHKQINGGHMGAKKFWREMLPRIKYRNPSIPIQISRHDSPSGPALLHIYTASAGTPSADAASSSPEPTPTHTIDMKLQTSSLILQQLIEKTKATILDATEQEQEELAALEIQKARSEADRALVREKLDAKRREEKLLRLARGELEAASV
ncbi:hypothetical protein P154DRAFT_518712 [Amniculicola lignicola CBS 123094]|uniref:Ribosomal protein/NADH dehydrogenase domain-containing protein n=1 Tax=Amniculicola lignicola CBS 123094 TaxID=1392246 RepID=A0A6A5WWR2_9PLEO|nr:hypothetical protein P154DRAFT_518712 [Amniculicola lignicola CBS 123094]